MEVQTRGKMSCIEMQLDGRDRCSGCDTLFR